MLESKNMNATVCFWGGGGGVTAHSFSLGLSASWQCHGPQIAHDILCEVRQTQFTFLFHGTWITWIWLPGKISTPTAGGGGLERAKFGMATFGAVKT